MTVHFWPWQTLPLGHLLPLPQQPPRPAPPITVNMLAATDQAVAKLLGYAQSMMRSSEEARVEQWRRSQVAWQTLPLGHLLPLPQQPPQPAPPITVNMPAATDQAVAKLLGYAQSMMRSSEEARVEQWRRSQVAPSHAHIKQVP